MRWIDLCIVRASQIGTGLALLLLVGVVLIQVVGRTIGASPVWTEELTRFALLYMVAFGVGLSLRSGDLVNVDIVCESLPGRWPQRLRLLSNILVAGLCGWLIYPASRFVSIGKMQTSPALGLRMDIPHASIIILLGGLCLFAILAIWRSFSGTGNEIATDRFAGENE